MCPTTPASATSPPVEPGSSGGSGSSPAGRNGTEKREGGGGLGDGNWPSGPAPGVIRGRVGIHPSNPRPGFTTGWAPRLCAAVPRAMRSWNVNAGLPDESRDGQTVFKWSGMAALASQLVPLACQLSKLDH